MATILRRLVSKKKKRFQEDGFDLDLTYVTPNVIAMGFPSSSFESIYRNPLTQVKKFLTEKHENCYQLWNLCAEKQYDAENFNGRVVDSYQFYDHNAPTWNIVVPCLQSIHSWLQSNPNNVAVIHCKAGKGRTGVVISAYLLFSGICSSAKSALEFYAERRTKNNKGVTIPSQTRYVYYLERVLQLKRGKSEVSCTTPTNQEQLPVISNSSSTSDSSDGEAEITKKTKKKLDQSQSSATTSASTASATTPVSSTSEYITPFPNQKLQFVKLFISKTYKGLSGVNFKIEDSNFNTIYNYQDHHFLNDHDKDTEIVLDCSDASPLLQQDVKFTVTKMKRGKPKKIFTFWINLDFIENNHLLLKKFELDKAYKDCKKNEKYPSDFQVQLFFKK